MKTAQEGRNTMRKVLCIKIRWAVGPGRVKSRLGLASVFAVPSFVVSKRRARGPPRDLGGQSRCEADTATSDQSPAGEFWLQFYNGF